MQKSNLIQLLSTLSNSEMERFLLFVQSPYHNQKLLPLRLLEILSSEFAQWKSDLAASPKQKIPCLAKEFLFEQLYPGQTFQDQRMRRIMMELQQLLEAFIHREAPPSQPEALARDLETARWCLNRGHLKQFEKRFRALEKKLAVFPYQNDQYFLFSYKIERLRNDFRVRTEKMEDSMDRQSEFLDRYYLITKLEEYAAMLTREKRYPQRHTFPGLKRVEAALLETGPGAPAIHIWEKVFRIEKGEQVTWNYRVLQELLQSHKHLLPPYALRQIRGYMLNHLIRQARNASRQAYREIFLLFRNMETEGTLYHQDRISTPFFQRCVQAACMAGESNWAQGFMARNLDRLSGQQASMVAEWCQVLVYFYQGEYAQVLRESSRFRFSDQRYEVMLRALQLRAYYQLGEAEDFFRLCDAFRKYLSGKSALGKGFQAHYAAFVRMIERLGRFKFEQRQPPHALHAQLEQASIAEKLWLREALSALLQ